MFSKLLNKKYMWASGRGPFRFAVFVMVGIIFCMLAGCGETRTQQADATQLSKDPGLQLMGNRFFALSTIVRVNQIETSRDVTHGEDESSIHSPKEARVFRQTIEKSWPGARICLQQCP